MYRAVLRRLPGHMTLCRPYCCAYRLQAAAATAVRGTMLCHHACIALKAWQAPFDHWVRVVYNTLLQPTLLPVCRA